MGHFQLLFAT